MGGGVGLVVIITNNLEASHTFLIKSLHRTSAYMDAVTLQSLLSLVVKNSYAHRWFLCSYVFISL
jgi:hypothetical protein